MSAPITVEVRIRAFYTSKECTLAPAITMLGTITPGGEVHVPMTALATDLVQSCIELADMPVTGLRAMTDAEIKAYRAKEDEEGEG